MQSMTNAEGSLFPEYATAAGTQDQDKGRSRRNGYLGPLQLGLIDQRVFLIEDALGHAV